jgi:hypothetical protein
MSPKPTLDQRTLDTWALLSLMAGLLRCEEVHQEDEIHQINPKLRMKIKAGATELSYVVQDQDSIIFPSTSTQRENQRQQEEIWRGL